MTYVRMKRRRCESAGIESRHVALPATSTTQDVVDAVTALSDDPGVHGILVQHSVGPHIDERAAFEAIEPAKDVDGVTMHSFATVSSACRASSPERPAESCVCWTSTTSTSRESGRTSWGAAPSSAGPQGRFCSAGTPP